MNKQQLYATAKNRNLYKVLKPFRYGDESWNVTKVDSEYLSSTIYDWGLNPATLEADGYIEKQEKEP